MFRGLPRAFWILCGGALINRLGSFVVPFLAIYLTTVRGIAVERAGFTLALHLLERGVRQPVERNHRLEIARVELASGELLHQRRGLRRIAPGLRLRGGRRTARRHGERTRLLLGAGRCSTTEDAGLDQRFERPLDVVPGIRLIAAKSRPGSRDAARVSTP